MSDAVNKELLLRIAELEENQQEQVLHYINHLLEEDFADRLSQDQIASIKRGLSDIKQGNTVSHDQIRKRYEQWL